MRSTFMEVMKQGMKGELVGMLRDGIKSDLLGLVREDLKAELRGLVREQARESRGKRRSREERDEDEEQCEESVNDQRRKRRRIDDYETELSQLRQENERLKKVLAKKLEEMQSAHAERVEEERKRGEAKKARRIKVSFPKENNNSLSL